MTSIVIVRQSDRISLLSDGAAYRSDGTLLGEGAKVFPLPHLNAAVAVRGSSAALAMVAGWIVQNVFSYDEIAQRLPEVLAILTPTEGQGEPIEVFVVGWSGATPDSFLMVNHDRHAEAPALVAVDTGDVACIPGDGSVATAAQTHLPPNYTSVDQLDAETVGLAMMEAQRLLKVDVPGQFDAGKAHIVGRFAQLTTVEPHQITTRILKRWPDALGQPITP